MTEIKKIKENVWEILKEGNMLVPGRIFASDKLMENIKNDKTLEQVKNVSCLSGIKSHSFAMPDSHQGYGFSIGGVAAFDLNKGIISPGGVGYDINCGVRVLTSNIKIDDFLKKRTEILERLYINIPSGVGKGAKIRIDKKELREICENGVDWCIENGYATEEDKERTEEYGHMKGADFNSVSDRATKRGMPQLGSLGAGNHFLEVQKVEEIFDEKIAESFGVDKDNILIMLHCGSRGFGHQIASDYIQSMEEKYGFENLPDRELICAPFKSELGQNYYKAMCCAVNYAFCNRQMITHWIRETFKEFFPDSELRMIYDVAHNIAKIEEHKINNKTEEVCIHRKGATRSFGPGRKEIPDVYRKIGQPVLIPGSMGTFSYILVGTSKAEEISFGSTAHGAGRVMSRHGALREFKGEEIKKQLEKQDIKIKAGGWKSIAEEAPGVYKDINEVVKVSHELGIGNLVVKLKPLAVMKG
ncbi:RtcB family protein [Candidatus Woesearchaeota archaeon]|nr:RtcB family protein [Candidatus Woesearchaeota archaeon]